MTTIAVCVFAIGEDYKKFYEKYFKKSQERYCKKYGYDFLVFEDFIDERTDRHIPYFLTYQKLLIANHHTLQKYDYILILDADIYILKTAGPLSELISKCGDKIGAVNEAVDPSKEIREEINKRKQWPITPTEYYFQYLPDKHFQTDTLINTGFLFVQPKLHKDFYEVLDRMYGDAPNKHENGAHYEQAVLGYELQKQDLVQAIDSKWNCIFLAHAENNHQNLMEPEFFFDVFLQKYWFLHFCAKQFLGMAEFLESSGF